MRKILRVYIGPDCIKEPGEVVNRILNLTESLDIDYAEKSGRVKMGTTSELAGEKVMIGDQEFVVPVH
jgi:hypothetical protein